jgi:hypothetical protein
MYCKRFQQSPDGTQSPDVRPSVIDWQYPSCQANTHSPVRQRTQESPLRTAEGLTIGAILGTVFWIGVWIALQ